MTVVPIETPSECIVCGARHLRQWGSSNRHSRPPLGLDEFALYPGNRYQTYRCENCEAVQKSPLPSADALAALYQTSTDGEWGMNQDPQLRHFDLLEAIAANSRRDTGSSKVLDFGCSNGELLKSWGSHWSKYGVEPSNAASALAEKNGLTMLSKADYPNYQHFFDVIVTVDVVEHLLEPAKELRALSELLRPTGRLIVMTGNTDAVTFKIAKGGYWYCDIPEHVVFFNPASCEALAKQLSLEVKDIKTLCHYNANSHRHHLKQSTKFYAYFLFKNTVAALFSNRLKRTTYPNLASAKDHMIVSFEKPLSNKPVQGA